MLGGVNEVASGFVIAGGVLGALAGLGAVWAYVRHGARTETVRLQREEIEAQRQRLDTLTEEKRDLARSLADEAAKVRALQAQVKILTDLVTQAAEVAALRKEHGEHHTDVMSALARIEKGLGAMPKVVAVPTPAIVGGKRASDPSEEGAVG